MKVQQNNNSFGEKVANYAAAGATAIFLLAITTGFANAEDVKKQQVFFTATVNGGAALIPVSWTVTGPKFVQNDKRHQFRLKLATGNYTAKLVCNKKTMTKTFPVVARDNSITVIPTPSSDLKIALACD